MKPELKVTLISKADFLERLSKAQAKPPESIQFMRPASVILAITLPQDAALIANFREFQESATYKSPESSALIFVSDLHLKEVTPKSSLVDKSTKIYYDGAEGLIKALRHNRLISEEQKTKLLDEYKSRSAAIQLPAR